MTNIFKSNIDVLDKAYQAVDKRFFYLSWLRVGIFLLGIGSTIFLFLNHYEIGSFLVLIFTFFLFGFIVNRHRKVSFERRQLELKKEVNEREINRLRFHLQDIEDGHRFSDDAHNYSSDLDLFGRNSLFQLLNRTNTPSGQEKLSKWLIGRAEIDDILQRQEAIRELSPLIGWRQELEALSNHVLSAESDKELETLTEWLEDEDDFDWLLKWSGVIRTFNIGLLGLIIAGVLSINWLFLPLVIGLLTIRNVQQSVTRSAEVSYQSVKLLKSYELLVKSIISLSPESQLLRDNQGKLTSEPAALQEIERLTRLMEYLNNRGNMLYWSANVIFLIDITLIKRIEKWKKTNRRYLSQWIESISEVEVLSGLSGFAYANPDNAYPDLVSTSVFSTKSIAHPLIPHDKRVSNDFELGTEHHIGIITGSNMAGKSTFLRTVGINIVLAQCGSVVTAQEMTLGKFNMFTSMRTSDNLEESVSSFYAELKRIQKLLQIVDGHETVFFLLDEILKGTNTHDRQLGAKSLIIQLLKTNSVGLVSTHDLALGELNSEHDNLKNLHFASEVIDDQLVFDYRIKEGVCKSFNASQLMAQIGIEIKDIQEDE